MYELFYHRTPTVLIPGQSNILVDVDGCARITDFGLATITQRTDFIWITSQDRNHSARWAAPEILGNWGAYTKGGDVFSFAMVTIEVRCR